jgi:kumamolisin
MQVYLAPRNRAQLDRLLDQLQDPASPRYRRFLSAAEYEARFRARRSATSTPFGAGSSARASAWTHASAAEAASRSRARSPPRELSFGCPHRWEPRRPALRQRRRAEVPASLAGKISWVGGLDNLNASRMHTKIPEPFNNQLESPHFGPPDVWTYTNSKALLDAGMNGAGQCIAVLNGSDVDQESLTMFNQFFGLPPFTPGVNYDVVYPDGPPGIAPAAPERVRGVRRGDPGRGVVARHRAGRADRPLCGQLPALQTQGLVNTLVAATTDNRCPIVSISWAQCGVPKSFFKMLDNYYKPGAAQGQTIFVATGDVGVAGRRCSTAGPAAARCRPSRPSRRTRARRTSPRSARPRSAAPSTTRPGSNTGVGTPAEQVWYFNIQNLIQSASTGGVSVVFRRPKFQKGIKSAKLKKRGVPDICLGGGNPAFPGYWECLDLGLLSGQGAKGPTCTTGGGTSIVPPQWSGIIAIILQSLSGGTQANALGPLAAGARVGNINRSSTRWPRPTSRTSRRPASAT